VITPEGRRQCHIDQRASRSRRAGGPQAHSKRRRIDPRAPYIWRAAAMPSGPWCSTSSLAVARTSGGGRRGSAGSPKLAIDTGAAFFRGPTFYQRFPGPVGQAAEEGQGAGGQTEKRPTQPGVGVRLAGGGSAAHGDSVGWGHINAEPKPSRGRLRKPILPNSRACYYWVKLTKFDAGRAETTVLESTTRRGAGTGRGASNLGGFGFKLDEFPAPGVLVSFPCRRSTGGPLKIERSHRVAGWPGPVAGCESSIRS